MIQDPSRLDYNVAVVSNEVRRAHHWNVSQSFQHSVSNKKRRKMTFSAHIERGKYSVIIYLAWDKFILRLFIPRLALLGFGNRLLHRYSFVHSFSCRFLNFFFIANGFITWVVSSPPVAIIFQTLSQAPLQGKQYDPRDRCELGRRNYALNARSKIRLSKTGKYKQGLANVTASPCCASEVEYSCKNFSNNDELMMSRVHYLRPCLASCGPWSYPMSATFIRLQITLLLKASRGLGKRPNQVQQHRNGENVDIRCVY